MQIKQTKKLESVLLGGCYEARRRSSSEVTTDHLFLAILKQEESHASHVLRKLLKNWEIDQIKTRLEREMGPVVAQDGRSQALRQTIAINGESMLRQIISDAGKGCVVEHMLNTGHLLRAILDDRSSISSRILALYNVTGETAAPFLKDLPPNEDYYENMRFLSLLGDDEGEHPERLFSGVMRIGAPAGDKPKDSMLDQFGSRSDALRRRGQARSGDRPRGRDRAGDPDSGPPQKEQSGADRRGGRRQVRLSSRGWRCASFRRACPTCCFTSGFFRSTCRRWWPERNTGDSSRSVSTRCSRNCRAAT